MRVSVLAAGALLVVARPAFSATIYVSPDYSGDYATIQDAVDAARDGDEIILGDGRFRNSGNWGVLVRRKALTIRSESGDPARCVIDCGGVNRAFQFEDIDGVTQLRGFSVVRGGEQLFGGAILLWGAPGSIQGCAFRGNAAEGGGAIGVLWCSASLNDCVFFDNIATQGKGGAVEVAYGSLEVSRCTLARNGAIPAERGGAIFCVDGSSVTVDRSIISGSLFGEALYCQDTSTARVSCSNVFGNAGGDWVGSIADQWGLDGNFSMDPLYCDELAGLFTLRPESPCASGLSACGLVGALPVACEDAPSLTARAVGDPFPNPSTGDVRVHLDVPPSAIGTYELEILDVAGRRVVGRSVQASASTSYSLHWDGLDGADRAVAPGVYFLSLRGPGFHELRKITRLR